MTGRVYYNEFDPHAAAWLRALIAGGHLPAGDVDERSIIDVQPGDLAGYNQCHFFAGIGGWPYALRLAGWRDDRPVWTGSCPCQPFSAAGKRKAGADDRHLWPAWLRLIRECRPQCLIGEQVEGAVGLGWLDRVFADLEAEGYACGAAVLGAHSVGAPHIRQRLLWVADADQGQCGRLANSQGGLGYGSAAGWQQGNRIVEPSGASRRLERPAAERASGHAGFWSAAEWLPCFDGKARRVEPRVFPLAHGSAARVVRLRGYGNAIVPQVAAEFVRAFQECQ